MGCRCSPRSRRRQGRCHGGGIPSSRGIGLLGAHRALLGPGVSLCRTEYDTEAAAEVIAPSRDPNGREWARECALSHYPDTEVLAAFTKIVRQQEGLAL